MKIRGFTLIELLVVFAVTGILSAVGIAAFVNYSRQQQVNQAVNDLKNNLRIAQSKALTQEIPSGCNNFSAYELKFADDGKSYTVYPICSDTEGSPKVTTNFPSQVSKVAGGPSTIRFKILTGAVDGAGTITLSGFDKTMCVEVTSVGRIQNLSADLCSSSGIGIAPTPTPTPFLSPPAGPTPTPTPSTLKVFVTNASYTGNLGRLFGADQKCQQAADAVSSLQGKLWRAWLSDSNTSAKDRVSDSRFIRIDNVVVAQNKQDLLDGNLLTPINVTETGGTPSVYAAESNPYVWTGTDASGNATSYNCANWDQPQAASGTLGLANATDSRWTNGAVGSDPQCQTYQRHLYCFEQPTPSSTGGPGCLTAYQDFDNDGYTTGSAVYFCNTSSLPYGYKSSPSTPTDCYDQNPNAKPGQTQFFSTYRGDGSFDYNCDGTVSPQYSNVGVSCYGYSVTKNSNCSFTNPTFTCFIGSATTASNCGQQGGWTGNSPAGYYMWNEADCDLTDLADAANEKLACR